MGFARRPGLITRSSRALVNLGVPSDRLSTRAHGSGMPVADNGTATGRQMNRRVEIMFAPQREKSAIN